MTLRRHQSSAARSVLRRVSRMKLKQEQKRKRISQGKWVRRAQFKRQSKRLVVMSTWNTRQLGATTGYIDQDLKLNALMDIWDLRKWELIALTDTKLCPSNTLGTHNQTRPNWTILSRGRVALALKERWFEAWQHSNLPMHTDGNGQQCRMMLVHIPCFQRLGLAIIITYAPSSNASPEDHATYYTNLEALIAKVRPRFTLLIAGDFNAEVGTRSHETGNALGPHGPSHRTNRGLHLCQFCNEHGLAVANTWTPQRTKATWWHPRFGTSHLIDFFLISHAHIGNTHRVLTISPDVARTAHLGEWTPYTDHNPVEMTIKMGRQKAFLDTANSPPPRNAQGPWQISTGNRATYAISSSHHPQNPNPHPLPNMG